jgi:hypothetical protein
MRRLAEVIGHFIGKWGLEKMGQRDQESCKRWREYKNIVT